MTLHNANWKTVSDLRDITVQLRQARNAGRWQTEQNLWASLAEAINDLENDEPTG